MANEDRILSALLRPGRIGTLEVRNRILMAPMGSNLSEVDGTLGERILAYYEARARGGAGLLTVGSVGIAWPRGATNPRQVAISDDRFIPGLSELARRAHRHGAKVALQIHHGGRNAVHDIAARRPLFVASPPRFRGANDKAQALTREESAAISSMTAGERPEFAPANQTQIDELIEDFACAAERAQRAGIDGIEVHAAHGYAIAGFLSPAWNHREDAYGGTPTRRARLLCETLRAIRARVGADYPVWCRIDACEFRVAGGITIEDAQHTARLAQDAGADAIHVSAYSDGSSGIGFTDGPLVHAQSGYVPFARAIKRDLSIPVIAVGRIEPAQADRSIELGEYDFLAMGRKLIADPELPNKLARGRPEEIRPCTYCYRCVGEVCIAKSLRCDVNPAAGHEFEYEIVPAPQPRRLCVIGAGPGALETARVAALRGHHVTLFDRDVRFGGSLATGALLHAPDAALRGWFEHELARLGVEVDSEPDVGPKSLVERVARASPDVIVLSDDEDRTTAFDPTENTPLTVVDLERLRDLVSFEAALEESPAPRVAVLGSDRLGLDVAAWLADRGAQPIVLEEDGVLAAQMPLPPRWRSLHELRERGVALFAGVRAVASESGAVSFETADGPRERIAARFVVRARRPRTRTSEQPSLRSSDSASSLGASLREICDDLRLLVEHEPACSDEGPIAQGFVLGRAL